MWNRADGGLSVQFLKRWVVTAKNQIKTLSKSGQKEASFGFSVVPPPDPPTRGEIPLIGGMNTYHEFLSGEAPPSNPFYVQDVITQAEKEHYRITACTCGGPRIHSRMSGHSKCFRCGLVEVSDTPLTPCSHQKCRRCKTYRWAVEKALYCDACAERLQKANAHTS